jgi:hypothetical protein
MNAKQVLSFTALLLPLPVLLGSNAPATRIAFTVAEGASLTKTFEVKVDMTLEEMTSSMGAAPDVEMTMDVTYKVVVTDEYAQVADGAPRKLDRTYDALSSDVTTSTKFEMMGQSRSQDSDSKAESELEGKTVRFTWDEEKSEYVKAFEPAGGEEKLLEGLREDMDLRALLPDGEVEEGAEWELDPRELVDVLAPGGDLSLRPTEAEAASMSMGASGMENLADMFGDDVTGTSKAKYTGLREVEGVKYAVIRLTLDIKASTDMSEAAREALAGQGPPEGTDGLEIDSMDVEFMLEAEGELLWDVANGHFHSLELSGTTGFKLDQAMRISVQGREMNMENTMEFAGTTSFSASAK